MAKITLQGQPIHTIGDLPAKASLAPNFTLTKTDLTEISLTDFNGQTLILNIFPSLDTPTCAISVKKFNSEATKLKDTQILCVSMDLPFAQKRFCGAEDLDKIMPVSAFRHPEFGENYGVKIIEGKLAGLLARAIIIINKDGKIIYTEQVGEISEEPDYASALASLS